MLECLTNIIGVSLTNCGCALTNLTDEQKAKLKLSTSKVYMDQIIGAPSLNEIKMDNDCTTLAQWCLDAIPAASAQFEVDLLASITSAAKLAKNAYKGDVGQTSHVASLKASKPIQFMKVAGFEETDAVMTIRMVRVYVNAAGTYNFYMYKEVPSTGAYDLVYTGAFTATRPGPANISMTIEGNDSLEFPLSVDGSPIAYYFGWDRGTAQGYDNDVDCGCSSGPGYQHYIIVSGGEAVDVASMPVAGKLDRKSHGVQLNVLISCQSSNVICKNMESNEAIRAVIANMIAFKANMIVVQKILDSNTVNRYTMMSRDAQYGKLSQFKAEYNGRMQHLVLVFDTTLSDCFECQPSQVWKGTILS